MIQMRMHRRIVAVAALTTLGAMGACDNGLTDINRNPNSPEVVPVEFLLAGGIWTTVVSSGSAGFHNSWTMLYHTSLWSQHVAQSYEFVQDRYSPRPGISSQIWDNAYADAIADFEEIKEIGLEEERSNLWVVGEIMQVYNFLTLTDLYGSIPYFDALKLDEGIRTPEYDPQEEIYPDILARLEAAVGMIDAGESTASWARGDLVYGGDIERWRRFGNSLRLRAAMRIADTPLSQTAQAAFADAWSDGVMQTQADAAEIEYAGEPPSVNSLFQNIVQGGRTGDFRVSETMIDTLLSLADPRLSVYAQPSVTGGVYRGLRNGMDPVDTTIDGREGNPNDYSQIGEYFLTPTSPSVIMSLAEVYFLGAEAAERGWIGASPQALYESGIRASMEDYGIADAQINTYLQQSNVAYDGLESIHMQKWIALYLQGPEVFNEFRRTGVPELELAENATQPDFPQRLPYPSEESLYNPDNFPTGVDLMTPVWWSYKAQ